LIKDIIPGIDYDEDYYYEDDRDFLLHLGVIDLGLSGKNKEIVEDILKFAHLKKDDNNIIIIKYSNLGSLFHFIKSIMKYRHCASFSMSNLYEMNYFAYNNKKILKIKFDTKSG
jgi:hypothetical protein